MACTLARPKVSDSSSTSIRIISYGCSLRHLRLQPPVPTVAGRAVVYMASLPLEANVLHMTARPRVRTRLRRRYVTYGRLADSWARTYLGLQPGQVMLQPEKPTHSL